MDERITGIGNMGQLCSLQLLLERGACGSAARWGFSDCRTPCVAGMASAGASFVSGFVATERRRAVPGTLVRMWLWLVCTLPRAGVVRPAVELLRS